MPTMESYLEIFLREAAHVARMVICISRWPVDERFLSRLTKIKNFRLVVGITGNRYPVEKVPVRKHMETLSLARDLGIEALPICHPYIAGVSDFSFLPELYALGYRQYSVRGLLPDPHMEKWMPAASLPYYQKHRNRKK
jgi:hypothetical protein